jgi:steroid delta-isomerase-like uncharacterized protein
MKKVFYLLLSTSLFTSCMNPGANDNSAANKEKTQKFYEDVFNGHNVDAVTNYCSDDFIDHQPDKGHSGKGAEDLKADLKEFFSAYPDLHATTKFMVAKGDTVISYITMTGTNSGAMGQMPPTNKSINIDGIDMIVIKNGKAVERWGFFDSMKMMEQLGMMGGGMGTPDSSRMANKMDEQKK